MNLSSTTLTHKRVLSVAIPIVLANATIPILGAVSIFGIKNIIISEDYNFAKINFIAILLSFIFSLMTIKYFLRFIKKSNLNFFVCYRVLLGIILLSFAYL